MQKCFISAPAGVKLGKIKKVLSENGLDAVHLSEIPGAGLSIVEKVTDAISDAELFIAVLDQSKSNENTLFELGLAYAQNKQILILAPPGVSIPTDISGLLYIQSGVDNVDALRFAIEQLLSAPKRRKRPQKSQIISSKPLGHKADNLLTELDEYSEHVSGYELVKIVTKLLEQSGISVIAPSKLESRKVDLAIWVDELEAVLGNPILIEIKERIDSQEQVMKISNQILEYISKSNSRYALLIYHEGLSQRIIQDSIGSFNILCFQLRELIQQLQIRSFGEVVRTTRNIIVHGGE